METESENTPVNVTPLFDVELDLANDNQLITFNLKGYGKNDTELTILNND